MNGLVDIVKAFKHIWTADRTVSVNQEGVSFDPYSRAIVLKIFGKNICLPLDLLDGILYVLLKGISVSVILIFLPLVIIFSTIKTSLIVFDLNDENTVFVDYYVVKLGIFAIIRNRYIGK